MKIGLSFGRCIRDIVNGDVKLDDIVVIVAKTRMTRDDLDQVVGQYMWRADYLAGLDQAKCLEVAYELWDRGLLHQPRTFGCKGYMTPEQFVWLDLVPTKNNSSLLVQEAWDQYQVALRMSENVPQAPDSANSLK